MVLGSVSPVGEDRTGSVLGLVSAAAVVLGMVSAVVVVKVGSEVEVCS